MVSARVFSEICKMSASPGVSRNLTCGRQLQSIKRNLFGAAPSNLLETKTNAFSAELERHQELATQKWGFDFRADRPLNANGSYIWERVSSQESNFAPQMYTLTRAAHVRSDVVASDMDMLLMERADRENLANSSLDSNTDNEGYDSQNELVASTSAAALTACSAASSSISASTSSASSCSNSTQQRKRQLKITEFMKERKRLAQAPKKISPAKRMRTNSGSSSAVGSSASSGSIGAQFGCLLKRSRSSNNNNNNNN
ncbi:hypothetical protein KR222_009627 [Zaprionus bogoriensis]|nr:hypothetical protein KR222_009627 [Zaprionus bogoriensis]